MKIKINFERTKVCAQNVALLHLELKHQYSHIDVFNYILSKHDCCFKRWNVTRLLLYYCVCMEQLYPRHQT